MRYLTHVSHEGPDKKASSRRCSDGTPCTDWISISGIATAFQNREAPCINIVWLARRQEVGSVSDWTIAVT